MTDDDRFILQMLAINGAMTTSQMVAKTGMNGQMVRRHLKSLHRYGFIKRETVCESTESNFGHGKSRYIWHI